MNMELGQILDSLGWAILHSLWQCSVVLIVVIMFRGLTRDSHATLRYSFQLFSLFLCLAAFTATFLFYQLAPNLAGGFGGNAVPYTSITEIFASSRSVSSPPVSTGLMESLTPFTPLLGVLWCLGFAALGFRYVAAFAITQRLRRVGLSPVPTTWNQKFDTLVANSGIRRHVGIYISNRVNGPMTLGFFKPVVLVPASFFSGLPADQIEAILLHEIGHIRRHDYLINLFQTLIRTVFFFHPAVYVMSRLIDNDRELACDDFAVARTQNPKALARGLVALRLDLTSNRFALAAQKGNTPLMARLNRLGYGATTRRRPEHVLTSVGILALVAALIPAASPPADAGMTDIDDMGHTAAHPSAKLGNYTFEKITKNGRDFTAKVASDGTQWINVDGTWHNVDECPDMIAKLPAVPVPPAPPKFREQNYQLDVDTAYYNARVSLESVSPVPGHTQNSDASIPQYNTAQLDRDLEKLRNRRQTAFVKSHKSRESAQNAYSHISPVQPPKYLPVQLAENHLENVASWTSPDDLPVADIASVSKVVLINNTHLPAGGYADDWMDAFITDIVKIETAQALKKLGHKDAEKAREKAEERFNKRMEKSHQRHDTTRQQTERQHEIEEARRELAEARRERAIETSHHYKYENFNRAMLTQLKKDGLIPASSEAVTVTYPDLKMTVNGVSVPDQAADNYCGILKSYKLKKSQNTRIEISPHAFSYSSKSGNSSHIIEEEFEHNQDAHHPYHSSNDLAGGPTTRETSVGQRTARLSPI